MSKERESWCLVQGLMATNEYWGTLMGTRHFGLFLQAFLKLDENQLNDVD